MIDVLNLMDGDPRAGRLDERMFVVLGNQVSDQIAFTYRPVDERGAPAQLLKAAVRPPKKALIDVTDTSKGDLRIVANAYLKTSALDGYDTILPTPEAGGCAASGSALKKVLYAAFKAQGRITSGEPGRICTDAETRSRTCLALQPGSTP